MQMPSIFRSAHLSDLGRERASKSAFIRNPHIMQIAILNQHLLGYVADPELFMPRSLPELA